MLRKIPVESLVPGMYVVDLHKSWYEHSLWRRCFLVRDPAVAVRLMEDGIREVSIDTARGIDLPAESPVGTACRQVCKDASAGQAARPLPAVSLEEERHRARRLLGEVRGTVQDFIYTARTRRGLDLGRLEPLVGEMMDSVGRHPDALVPLACYRRTRSYAADHAAATAVLIIALGCRRRLAPHEIEKLALGALLKDIGQTLLNTGLGEKPGKLSRDELTRMRAHVEAGLALLKGANRLSEVSLALVLEHHERWNGSGYPGCKVGNGISVGGRMAAIVDSYDAMTSNRPYRRALSPASALRQIYKGGGTLFDADLVASFVRALGIFPVGTLIRLESGHLGVVEENCQEQPLRPVVRVIYDAGRRQPMAPVRLDLNQTQGNPFGQIVRMEEFRNWNINPQNWLPA